MKMQRIINRSGRLKLVANLLVLTALGVAAAPGGAEAALLAGTSGNALLRNTVSVAYSDANGIAQAVQTAHVDITVNTVAAAPTIFNFDASATTDGTGSTQIYHAWVKTNSNGPGTVSLAGADGSPINMAVSGTGPTAIPSVYLGSTMFDPNGNAGVIGTAQTLANNASITVAVPNDQQITNDAGSGAGATGANSPVNALAVNDIVYVTDGVTSYGPLTVTATANNTPGTGLTAATSSITLTNKTGATLPTFTPTAGWQIEEAKQFTFTVTEGVVTNQTLLASWITTITGTMGALNNTGSVTTNAKEGLLSVAKYVRNVSVPVIGSTPLSFNADVTLYGSPQTYYLTGVNGKPTDTLEYMIVLKNIGLGATKSTVATDQLPTYSTLVVGSPYGTSGGGTIFAHGSLAGTETDMTTGGTGLAAVGFGGASGSPLNMTFDLGTGSAWTVGGTLATGATEYVIYRVTIN